MPHLTEMYLSTPLGQPQKLAAELAYLERAADALLTSATRGAGAVFVGVDVTVGSAPPGTRRDAR